MPSRATESRKRCTNDAWGRKGKRSDGRRSLKTGGLKIIRARPLSSVPLKSRQLAATSLCKDYDPFLGHLARPTRTRPSRERASGPSSQSWLCNGRPGQFSMMETNLENEREYLNIYPLT